MQKILPKGSIHLPMRQTLTGSQQYQKIITPQIGYLSIAILKIYCIMHMCRCCVCTDKYYLYELKGNYIFCQSLYRHVFFCIDRFRFEVYIGFKIANI